MANPMEAVQKSASEVVAPTDPQVVAVVRRRHFSPATKRRILAAADRCTRPGEIGALLRREAVHCSQLAAWRKRRGAKEASGLDTQKRSTKADPAAMEGLPTGW